MSYSIGGEFGISLDIFLQTKLNNQPAPYHKKYQVLVDTGRSALYLALAGILQKGGSKEAWVPRFCCESVVLAFHQLGFNIYYYSMGNNLQEAMLPERVDGGTFLFINYFGKKNNSVINWLNEHAQYNDSLFIIEDNVQSSLSTNSGNHGDFVINSYRKFLPQPDGAVLAYDQPIKLNINQPDEAFISAKLAAKLIRENQGNTEFFLDLLSNAEKRIDHIIQPRSMSCLSKFLFARTDLSEISTIRRSNWNYLLGLLVSEQLAYNCIYPLFDSLEDGEVPLGFPIKVDPAYRDNLRKFLTMQKIYCPIHWPIPKRYKELEFKDDINLSESILTIPIDQRLNEAALDYLLEKLIIFFKSAYYVR